MKGILFLSEAIIPILILAVVGNGLLRKQNVYDDFLKGAWKGLKTVVEIMPTMVGLMIAVGILRASGFLDLISGVFEKLIRSSVFPGELIPLTIVKMFSSSAATGLLLDLYKEYGTDSRIGLIASLLLSSTETIFYTMSVYFMTAKVQKTRYTLSGALIATLAGLLGSVWIAGWL